MKKTLATTLSIVGVLGAGSAAALVNTQVMSKAPSEASASAALLPPADQVDLTVPTLATPPTTLATDMDPSTTDAAADAAALIEGFEARTTAAPNTTTAAQSPSQLTAFNVGESGVVTVDVVNGKLIIVDATPTPGWAKTESKESDDNGIEVDFASATVRVKFTAAIIGGQIVPSVESFSIPAPTSSTTPSDPTNRDDDDDDYEDDDDHDDDHDDDDDDRDDDRDDDGGDDEDDDRDDD